MRTGRIFFSKNSMPSRSAGAFAAGPSAVSAPAPRNPRMSAERRAVFMRAIPLQRVAKPQAQPISTNDFLDHPAVDIGEPVVAAAVAVGKLLVVDTHQVQDGGVQIVDVDLVLDCVPT